MGPEPATPGRWTSTLESSTIRFVAFAGISPAIPVKGGETLKEPFVACARCEDLCVRYAIRHPRQLRKAIQITAENIADKTLIQVTPEIPWVSVSFDQLAAGAAWDDYVEYHFRCLHCDEAFWLHVETYHGSGGYWEPKEPASIHDNITN